MKEGKTVQIDRTSKNLFLVLVFVMNIFILHIKTIAANYYVATNGSNSNPGTLSQPFLTIEKARDVIRTINSNMTEDIIVYLRGGRYQINSTIAFDSRDKGTNGYTIQYRNHLGESPRVSGGLAITGWTSIGNGIYKAANVNFNFRQLYINGKRGIRARTPNINENNKLLRWDIPNKQVYVNASEISNWDNFTKAEMVVEQKWTCSYLRLASYSPLGNEASIVFQNPEKDIFYNRADFYFANNQTYHFENAYEFLDQPGEWYLNETTAELFYMPRTGENMSTVEIIAPDVQTLISIQGTIDNPVVNLEFHGITFEHSTWLSPSVNGYVSCQEGVSSNGSLVRAPGAVYVNAADNIVFDSNTFHNLGSVGLDMEKRIHNNSITNNVFKDIAGSGIQEGYLSAYWNPVDPRELAQGNTISQNYITRVGQDYLSSCGIACFFTQNILIEHNEISDTPYTGIAVGWGWTIQATALSANIIRYNNIYNICNRLCDGGGIYVMSGQPDSTITGNYIHDIYRNKYAGAITIRGIYLDSGAADFTVNNNVVEYVPNEKVNGWETYNPSDNWLNHNTASNNGGYDSAIIANAGVQTTETQVSVFTVLNPSFENLDGNGFPSDWTRLYAGGFESSSTVRATLGSRSLMINDTSATASGGLRSNAITGLRTGKPLTVSVQCYAQSGTATLFVEFWDSSNQLITNASVNSTQTNVWQKLTLSKKVPVNAKYATVMLYSLYANTGISYYDDVKITNSDLAPGIVIYNNSFETLDNGLPAGWTIAYTNGFESISTFCYSDGSSKSLKFDDSSNILNGGVRSKCIPIVTGNSYTAKTKCYLESGTASSLYIEFFDSNEVWISNTSTSTATTGTWLPLSVTATAPANAVYAAVLVYSPVNTVGVSYFDAVDIFCSGTSVLNSSFESYDANLFPLNWKNICAAGTTAYSSDKRAYNLARSLRIEDSSNSKSAGARSNNVTGIIAGRSYTAAAKCYVESGNASIYIEFWNSSNSSLQSTFSTITTTGSWQDASVTATAPAGTSYATVLLYSNVANVGTSNFDSVSLNMNP